MEIVQRIIKLKRDLRQAHKLSRTENGFKGIRWWLLDDWGKDTKVKKEEPKTPLLNIKVEDPPTSHLTYPSTSPASSHYHSLDTNDFEN